MQMASPLGAYLDVNNPRYAQSFAFQPFINLIGCITINVRFFHQGKGDPVITLAELCNSCVVFWFLPTKLS